MKPIAILRFIKISVMTVLKQTLDIKSLFIGILVTSLIFMSFAYTPPDDVDVDLGPPFVVESNNLGHFMIVNASGQITIVDPSYLEGELLTNRYFWSEHERPTYRKYRASKKEARKSAK